MEKGYRLARIISNIFIPPTFLLLIFLYFTLSFNFSARDKLFIIITAMIFGFVLPIGVFIHLRMKRKVGDNDAVIKEERTIPYIAAIILYSLAALVSILFQLPVFNFIIWLSYIVSSIGMLLINRYWKISAHAIGAAAPLAILVFFNSILFPYVLAVVLTVAWSRYKLKVHTLSQIIGGLLYGFLLTLVQLEIYDKVLNVK